MQGYVSQADRALFRNRRRSAAAAAGLTMDKRIAPRRTARIPAFINIPERFELVSCRILDLSATGARALLDTADWKPARLPLEVTLIIPFERTEVTCLAVWVIGGEVGLTFQSAYRRR